MGNSVTVPLVVRTISELCMMIGWVHCIGCMWFLIGKSSETGWVHRHGLTEAPPSKQYFASIHWAVTQLQGGTDIVPGGSVGERGYAVSIVFLSILVLARLVSKFTTMMIEFHE